MPMVLFRPGPGVREGGAILWSRPTQNEEMEAPAMTTGVVLVTYNCADIIVDCLESFLASAGADLRIIVVDNCSRDSTVETVRAWAKGETVLKTTDWPRPFVPVAHGAVPLVEDPAQVRQLARGEVGLIRSPVNSGFGGGVNLGLEALLANPDVAYFWVLNPDCMAEPATAARLEMRARSVGRFGVIGGRILYTQPENTIQSDGGRINLWTGICVPYNMTCPGDSTAPPVEATLDYIAGTHMFLSREFIAQAGLMPEDYFLYYEEMDWCQRRGDLPLLFEAAAAVHHHGGHTIGSATLGKGPSALSAYFLNRARMKFIAKYRPVALPLGAAYSTARAVRALLRGNFAAGTAALRGVWGFGPTSQMMAKIGLDQLPKIRPDR